MAHALSARPTSVRNLVVAVVVAWFLLAVGSSLLGVFDGGSRPPIPLGLAAVVPIRHDYLLPPRLGNSPVRPLPFGHGSKRSGEGSAAAARKTSGSNSAGTGP